MEYKYKTRFCPVLETSSIQFPRISYGLPPCKVCPTNVPIPSNIQGTSGDTFLTITFDFNFRMQGDDHFLFVIRNANTDEEVRTMRFQQGSQYVIPNLVNNTPYTIEIIPVVNGLRCTSATSPILIPSTGIPGRFVGIALTGGSGEATFTYSTVNPLNPVPQFINILYDGISSNVAFASPFVLSNLVNGISYSITVRTFISPDRYGIPSTFLYIPGPPDTPAFSSIQGGNSLARIYFNIDTATHPTPDYYLVSISGTLSSQTLENLGGYVEYTGLTNTCDYAFYINSFANGFFSPSVATGSVYVGPPGPPQNIVGIPGFEKILLTWDPPALGSSVVEFYSARNNITTTTFIPESPALLDINLINGSGYTYDISSYGNGLYSTSVTSAVITPCASFVGTWQNTTICNVLSAVTTDMFGTWVAVGTGNSARSTTYGTSWTTVTTLSGYFGIASDEQQDGQFIAVGPGVPRISYDGGRTWSNSGASGIFSGLGRGVATDGNEKWVIVGEDNNLTSNTIKYSFDNGFTWTNASSAFRDVGYGVATDRSGTWVAVGRIFVGGSSIQYSTNNGVSWSNASGGFLTEGFGIATNGLGTWVAVGREGLGGNTIKYSIDNGSNWSNASGMFTVAGYSVAYGNGYWIACGSNSPNGNTIKYSTDASNWSNMTNTFTEAANGITTNKNGMWVAVGSNLVSPSPTIKYLLI